MTELQSKKLGDKALSGDGNVPEAVAWFEKEHCSNEWCSWSVLLELSFAAEEE